MHKQILKQLSDEKAKEFLCDLITKLKSYDIEFYEQTEDELYELVYGPHFNEWTLDKALADLLNEDGTKGPHWNIQQTTAVAIEYGITFMHCNEYDWNFVMNMIYSDYYGAISNETSAYVKLAKKFLADQDAPEGKAWKYHRAMHCCD